MTRDGAEMLEVVIARTQIVTNSDTGAMSVDDTTELVAEFQKEEVTRKVKEGSFITMK